MASPGQLGNKKYHQGYYKLKNQEKYVGNGDKIAYRSSWELAFCQYLDFNPKIIKWGMEQPVIVYSDMKGKTHRYFPDYFYQQLSDDDNRMKQVVVEVKPLKEVYEPVMPKNPTSKALENHCYNMSMYIKNRLKWDAAINFCKKRGFEFIIVTEEHLKKAGILKS